MVNVRMVVRRNEVILHASVFHMRSVVLVASIVPRARLALDAVAPHTQLTLVSIELRIQLVSISDECYADDWYGLASLLEVQLV